MLTSGTRPPRGMKESCHGVDGAAAGVGGDGGEERGVRDAEADFFAFHVAASLRCGGLLVDVHGGGVEQRVGLRLCPVRHREDAAKKRTDIAAKTAQPCAGDLVILPSVTVRPAGMRKMEKISRKFVSGVGFSKGCALLALKKPPPLVPSILMASWEATGPCAMLCVVMVCVVGFPSAPVVVMVCDWTSLAWS